FQKVWYYRDYIKKITNNPDIEYLKNFETKYKINLWQVAYSERFFFKYNQYYKFNYTEILSILENECKLFEEVLNEIQPDYLVIKLTDTHQSHLIHQLCKSKNITILMMGPTYFANHFSIHQEYGMIDGLENHTPTKERSLSELQEYLKSFRALDVTNKFVSDLKIIHSQKIKKYIHFLIKTGKNKFKNSYVHYGRTRISAISKFLFFKRWYRKKFIDKNFQKHIPNGQSFIYYPLQSEPERTLILGAPFYTDQLALITRLAKALPVDFKLYVKEHGMMSLVGWREISYYKKIQSMPNVVLFHPSIQYDELLTNCSLLATIRGTSGIEAAFYDKPTIIFADVDYSFFPSVHRVKNFEELPQIIKKMIHTKVDVSALNKYVDHVENHSFKMNLVPLYTNLHKFFFKEFNYVNGHISPTKMNSFFEKHRSEFEQLAFEHIKKINKTTIV
ncbi:MAG: hypothetical protein ACREAK_06395, partial [Nitrosarchaeum sp.]